MAKNITMKQKTSTGYETLYPQTTTEQITDLKSYGGAFCVGDIKQTVQTDLGEEWLLCNGQDVFSSQYPELFALLPSKNLFEGLTLKGSAKAGSNTYYNQIIKIDNSKYLLYSRDYSKGNESKAIDVFYSSDNCATWTTVTPNVSRYGTAESEMIYHNGYIYVPYKLNGSSSKGECVFYYSTNGTTWDSFTITESGLDNEYEYAYLYKYFIYKNELYCYAPRGKMCKITNGTFVDIATPSFFTYGYNLYSDGEKIYKWGQGSSSKAAVTVYDNITSSTGTEYYPPSEIITFNVPTFSPNTFMVTENYFAYGQADSNKDSLTLCIVSKSTGAQEVCILPMLDCYAASTVNCSNCTIYGDTVFMWNYSGGSSYFCALEIDLAAKTLKKHYATSPNLSETVLGCHYNPTEDILTVAGKNSSTINVYQGGTGKKTPTFSTLDKNTNPASHFYIKAK